MRHTSHRRRPPRLRLQIPQPSPKLQQPTCINLPTNKARNASSSPKVTFLPLEPCRALQPHLRSRPSWARRPSFSARWQPDNSLRRSSRERGSPTILSSSAHPCPRRLTLPPAESYSDRREQRGSPALPVHLRQSLPAREVSTKLVMARPRWACSADVGHGNSEAYRVSSLRQHGALVRGDWI